MLAVVITDEALKNELLAQPHASELQLHFIQTPEEYPSALSPAACIDLLFDGSAERSKRLQELHCPLTVINAVNFTLNETRPAFVRINAWPGFLKRNLVEAALAETTYRDSTAQLFALLGRKTEWVPDICGFISARVVATIINEAFFALEENISTETEIDTAMKLGTNYPFGPFEWAEKIGIKEVYTLLNTLAKNESRYLPCKLLEKKALA